jgi:hypothetical protein
VHNGSRPGRGSSHGAQGAGVNKALPVDWPRGQASTLPGKTAKIE